MARIGHLIRTIRRRTPNILTVDAGDIFQGTPFFKFYHGAVEVALLNMIDYDIYTIGNHEFDYGAKNLAKQLRAAKFDIVSANLDASAVPELAALVKPSVVKVINGRPVGFVGAIIPDLTRSSLTTDGVKVKGFDINQPDNLHWIEPIAREVRHLEDCGINKIILVTHCGLDRDKELAEALPDVDVIIGGHSHTRLSEPVLVNHADGTCTMIVQTGCYGRALGKTDLAFDKNGHLLLSQTHYHLINITDRIYEDADIAAFLEEKAKPFRAMRNTIAGTALQDIDNRFSHYPWDSPMGDLICDALAEAGTEYGVTIAFQNRGGIRGRLESGPITLEKVEEVLPFDNQVVFATISGATLLGVLEHSLSGNYGGKFLDLHGMQIAYDPAKPSGSRLVYARSRDARGVLHDVDPKAWYKIAVNSYSFNGGEGYDFPGARNVQLTGKSIADILVAYLHKHRGVSPDEPCHVLPLMSHLLTRDDGPAGRYLQLHSSLPHARLILVEGSRPGMTSIAGPVPVPFADPYVVQSGVRTDESGSYRWRLPIQSRNQSAGGSTVWSAVVIVKPARPSAAVHTIITAPVSVDCR